MAQTAAGQRLTIAQRAAQLAVRARSVSRLVTLWRAVEPTELEETISVFTEAAVILALSGYDESAGISSRYLALFREAEGIPGAPPAFIAPRPARAEVAATLRGAALAGIIDARRAGMSLSTSKTQGLVRVTGALIKQVLAGGRMTIIGSTQRDQQALGWTRVTSGDACAFCRMLASRGPAYKTERTADFRPHDACGCTAEPFYRGDRPSAQAEQYAREMRTAAAWARESGTMSSGTSNNALNNYRRWLANGSPEPGAVSDAPRGGSDGSTRDE